MSNTGGGECFSVPSVVEFKRVEVIRNNHFFLFHAQGDRCVDLVQTNMCSLLIMGPHIFQIYLC